MRDPEKQTARLVVDLAHVRAYDPNLAELLIMRPLATLPAFNDAYGQRARVANNKFYEDNIQRGRAFAVAMRGEVGRNAVGPRELQSPLLGQLVAVEGIVTRSSLVRPRVLEVVSFCEASGKFSRKGFSQDGQAGTVYPSRDLDGNSLTTECAFSAPVRVARF